jgi:hypothetical protein
MHIVQTVEALKTETCFTQLALLPGMSVHTMDLYTRIAICVCACIYMPVVARVHIWLCTSSNLSTFSPFLFFSDQDTDLAALKTCAPTSSLHPPVGQDRGAGGPGGHEMGASRGQCDHYWRVQMRKRVRFNAVQLAENQVLILSQKKTAENLKYLRSGSLPAYYLAYATLKSPSTRNNVPCQKKQSVWCANSWRTKKERTSRKKKKKKIRTVVNMTSK